MSNPILTIEGLCFGFGKKKVLQNLDIRLEQGEAVLIAGNNGVGKSTLLRCIAGVYIPEAGEIRFGNGVNNKKIGFISDKMSLFEDFTLKEGIEFHKRAFDTGHYDDFLIKPLNLNMHGLIKDLSNGERALYHMSLLFAQEPKLLLVDEIIHAMDPYLRELFLEGLIELIDEKGTTLVMVNHTFSEMGRIPERVLLMENGRFFLDEKRDVLDQQMKKVTLDSGKTLENDIPVVFRKNSEIYSEYYVYPFEPGMTNQYDYQFQDIELTEIIKSFIGGYYAKKRK